jgi:hypothetical protein
MAPAPNMVSPSFEGTATPQAAKMMPATPSTPSGHDDAASEAGSSRFPMTGTSAASSAAVSLASSSGHGRLAACPMGFFLCKLCKRQHPLSDMSARANVCSRDNSSYKSISSRWSKQRELKTWYDNMSDEQRAAWYLKQQQLPTGSKRNFEQIQYSESTSRQEVHVDDDKDQFISWTMYKRWGLLENKTLPMLEEEWAAKTTGPSTEAVWKRNQWCIPEFHGFSRGMESRDVQEQATFRGANVSTSEQLQVLQQGGRALLDQFRNSFRGAQAPMPSDMPLTDASVGDQPVTPAPADLMSQQIHREATVG